MNADDLRPAAARAASLMRALANEKRLMILCRLAEGEKTVGQIAEDLGVAQPNASQQLATLRNEGLVQSRRQAQSILYSLKGEQARRVIATLYDLYCCGAATTAAEHDATENDHV